MSARRRPVTVAIDADVRVEIHRDHTIFHPPATLLAKARRTRRRGEAGVEQQITAADSAVGTLSDAFGDWIAREIATLAAAADGLSGTSWSPRAVARVFQATHHLRGNAGFCGFPLAARIGDGLCRLLDRCPHALLPHDLVRQHLQAILAIVRENARGDDHPVGCALAERLESVTLEFIAVVAPDPIARPRSVKSAVA